MFLIDGVENIVFLKQNMFVMFLQVISVSNKPLSNIREKAYLW